MPRAALPRNAKALRHDMPTPGPAARPGILAIDAYVPGESKVPGGLTPAKLSSNETPLGASPKAIDAFRAAALTEPTSETMAPGFKCGPIASEIFA